MRKFQKQIRQLALGVALAGIWSPQVWAQSAPEDGDEVVRDNEIIVSARRKDETVQDVPMTVNVVTDQKLKDLNLFNGSDLVNVVPGLNFAPNIPGSTPTLALRGAAKGEAGGRLDPTVQTYMNEAPVTEVLVAEALYDIGQVEVLRGPQGTLRGRPSATGAITVTTKRPNLTKIEGACFGEREHAQPVPRRGRAQRAAGQGYAGGSRCRRGRSQRKRWRDEPVFRRQAQPAHAQLARFCPLPAVRNH